MLKAMLIWNPVSGRISFAEAVPRAAETLRNNGWKVRVEESRHAEHITDLARQAAEEKLDAVFVAGGDGSLRRAVAGLVGSGTALGVLPIGASNVWAKEIGFPSPAAMSTAKLVDCAKRLAAGSIRAIDVGICNGAPFILWAGFGLDGRVVNRLERKRSRLAKQLNEVYYALAGLQCAAGWPGMNLKVQTDDRELEGRFLVAVASNVRHYAGGLVVLSREAKLDDGKMELWLFASNGRGGTGTLLKHVWNLWRGKNVSKEDVFCLPFREAKLTIAESECIHLDGDPFPASRSVEIKVQTRALRVLLPGDL